MMCDKYILNKQREIWNSRSNKPEERVYRTIHTMSQTIHLIPFLILLCLLNLFAESANNSNINWNNNTK